MALARGIGAGLRRDHPMGGGIPVLRQLPPRAGRRSGRRLAGQGDHRGPASEGPDHALQPWPGGGTGAAPRPGPALPPATRSKLRATHPHQPRAAGAAMTAARLRALSPPTDARVERLAFGAAEAAEALGLDRSTIYKLIAAGQLRAFHAGRRLLISREALLRYIRAREEEEPYVKWTAAGEAWRG